jgi:hypothetical protein
LFGWKLRRLLFQLSSGRWHGILLEKLETDVGWNWSSKLTSSRTHVDWIRNSGSNSSKQSYIALRQKVVVFSMKALIHQKQIPNIILHVLALKLETDEPLYFCTHTLFWNCKSKTESLRLCQKAYRLL